MIGISIPILYVLAPVETPPNFYTKTLLKFLDNSSLTLFYYLSTLEGLYCRKIYIINLFSLLKIYLTHNFFYIHF